MSVYNRASDTSNPQRGHRLRDISVHDPFVLAYEETNTYYLYTTGIPRFTDLDRSSVLMYKSKNLAEWEGPYVVFSVPDHVWAHPEHGTWAPEVHQYNGKYYMFVTLHHQDEPITANPNAWNATHLRGTSIAISESPEGPFELLKTDGPVPPYNFMTLDGTLYKDEKGKPWMVYCHEWIQVIDGTFEAVPLKDDLSDSNGEPIHLFKASDAPWLNKERKPGVDQAIYVSDGCQLYRTKEDHLIMLWSSYNQDGYVQTIARSTSGHLQGPWEQLDPLIGADSGHGMLFQTFEGIWMLILHQPFQTPNSRAKIYQMEDTGDRFEVVCARKDLDS